MECDPVILPPVLLRDIAKYPPWDKYSPPLVKKQQILESFNAGLENIVNKTELVTVLTKLIVQRRQAKKLSTHKNIKMIKMCNTFSKGNKNEN